MDYNEYVISESGALSYRISVPCFIGDGGDFLVAARMNRFYNAALSEMFRYVTTLKISDVRRRSYNCSFRITEDDSMTVCVTLIISERILPSDCGRSQTMRKEVTHKWREGVIIKKTIR